MWQRRTSIYELPFGHNRRFGKNMNSALNAVVGEWQLSGIYSLHGGFPLTIRANDTTGTGSRGARANCLVPGTVFGKQNSPVGGYQWFDPSAYATPDRHLRQLRCTERFADPA